jgi:hypothetical protein
VSLLLHLADAPQGVANRDSLTIALFGDCDSTTRRSLSNVLSDIRRSDYSGVVRATRSTIELVVPISTDFGELGELAARGDWPAVVEKYGKLDLDNWGASRELSDATHSLLQRLADTAEGDFLVAVRHVVGQSLASGREREAIDVIRVARSKIPEHDAWQALSHRVTTAFLHDVVPVPTSPAGYAASPVARATKFRTRLGLGGTATRLGLGVVAVVAALGVARASAVILAEANGDGARDPDAASVLRHTLTLPHADGRLESIAVVRPHRGAGRPVQIVDRSSATDTGEVARKLRLLARFARVEPDPRGDGWFGVLPVGSGLELVQLSRLGKLDTLVRARGDDFGPKPSPDGRFLAFSTVRWGATPEEYRVDLALLDRDRGRVTSIANDSARSEGNPQWMSDGSAIAYIRFPYLGPRAFEVCRVRIATRATLCSQFPQTLGTPNILTWLDGDTLLVYAADSGKSSLVRFALGGTGAAKVIDSTFMEQTCVVATTAPELLACPAATGTRIGTVLGDSVSWQLVSTLDATTAAARTLTWTLHRDPRWQLRRHSWGSGAPSLFGAPPATTRVVDGDTVVSFHGVGRYRAGVVVGGVIDGAHRVEGWTQVRIPITARRWQGIEIALVDASLFSGPSAQDTLAAVDPVTMSPAAIRCFVKVPSGVEPIDPAAARLVANSSEPNDTRLGVDLRVPQWISVWLRYDPNGQCSASIGGAVTSAVRAPAAVTDMRLVVSGYAVGTTALLRDVSISAVWKP